MPVSNWLQCAHSVYTPQLALEQLIFGGGNGLRHGHISDGLRTLNTSHHYSIGDGLGICLQYNPTVDLHHKLREELMFCMHRTLASSSTASITVSRLSRRARLSSCPRRSKCRASKSPSSTMFRIISFYAFQFERQRWHGTYLTGSPEDVEARISTTSEDCLYRAK